MVPEGSGMLLGQNRTSFMTIVGMIVVVSDAVLLVGMFSPLPLTLTVLTSGLPAPAATLTVSVIARVTRTYWKLVTSGTGQRAKDARPARSAYRRCRQT